MKDYDYQFISRKVKTKKSPLKKKKSCFSLRSDDILLLCLVQFAANAVQANLGSQIDQKLADFSVDASETKDKKVKSEEKIFD